MNLELNDELYISNDAKIKDLTSKTSTLESKVSTLETKTNTNTTNISNLQTSVNSINTKLQVVTVSDFFQSTNVSGISGYIYKYGRILNIQRLSFKQATYPSSGELTVGTIKSKYRPVLDSALRIACQNENDVYKAQRGYIEAGKIILSGPSGVKTSGYIYNTTYICKE